VTTATADAGAGPLERARAGAPRPVLVAIGVGWALAIGAELTGSAHALHHDSLIHDGPPLWEALLLFLVAWQAMIAAMMLPSSLPLIRMFEAVSERQERPGRARAAFLGGYALVWTAFGAQAFLGDVGIHTMVDSIPWLHAHEWVIAGGVLAMAGLFQFSDLKEQCLSKCRQPGPYLMSHYRRGPGGALKLGMGHGLYCLGCCWALMLVMFAAGVAMLWWMAALTAVMVYEKTGRHGEAVTPVVGVTLLVLSALTFAHLPGLPSPFST
jgi:predicted metal-binding membrane protein